MRTGVAAETTIGGGLRLGTGIATIPRKAGSVHPQDHGSRAKIIFTMVLSIRKGNDL
jgi:hypothetical protein